MYIVELTACHEKLNGLNLVQDVYLERIKNDKDKIERMRRHIADIGESLKTKCINNPKGLKKLNY